MQIGARRGCHMHVLRGAQHFDPQIHLGTKLGKRFGALQDLWVLIGDHQDARACRFDSPTRRKSLTLLGGVL